jgi:cephalosporin-C deacetylase
VPLFDLSPDELVDHRPARSEPADFDAFWTATLAEARERPLAVDHTPCEPSLPLVEAEHLTFAGFAGDCGDMRDIYRYPLHFQATFY